MCIYMTNNCNCLWYHAHYKSKKKKKQFDYKINTNIQFYVQSVTYLSKLFFFTKIRLIRYKIKIYMKD